MQMFELKMGNTDAQKLTYLSDVKKSRICDSLFKILSSVELIHARYGKYMDQKAKEQLSDVVIETSRIWSEI